MMTSDQRVALGLIFEGVARDYELVHNETSVWNPNVDEHDCARARLAAIAPKLANTLSVTLAYLDYYERLYMDRTPGWVFELRRVITTELAR